MRRFAPFFRNFALCAPNKLVVMRTERTNACASLFTLYLDKNVIALLCVCVSCPTREEKKKKRCIFPLLWNGARSASSLFFNCGATASSQKSDQLDPRTPFFHKVQQTRSAPTHTHTHGKQRDHRLQGLLTVKHTVYIELDRRLSFSIIVFALRWLAGDLWCASRRFSVQTAFPLDSFLCGSGWPSKYKVHRLWITADKLIVADTGTAEIHTGRETRPSIDFQLVSPFSNLFSVFFLSRPELFSSFRFFATAAFRICVIVELLQFTLCAMVCSTWRSQLWTFDDV